MALINKCPNSIYRSFWYVLPTLYVSESLTYPPRVPLLWVSTNNLNTSPQVIHTTQSNLESHRTHIVQAFTQKIFLPTLNIIPYFPTRTILVRPYSQLKNNNLNSSSKISSLIEIYSIRFPPEYSAIILILKTVEPDEPILHGSLQPTKFLMPISELWTKPEFQHWNQFTTPPQFNKIPTNGSNSRA